MQIWQLYAAPETRKTGFSARSWNHLFPGATYCCSTVFPIQFPKELTRSINLPPSGGAPGAGGIGGMPSAGQQQSFAASIKGKPPKELGTMLGQKGLEPWKENAILQELMDQAKEKKAETNKGTQGADSGGEGEENELQKLLKKLRDGTISSAELQKLAGMLGIDPAALEGLKGGKKGGDAAAGGNTDIQGG